VIVEVESRELDLEGSALDAALLRERVAETLAELDARELASLPAFEGVVPTAELLARHIHHQLSKRFPVVAGFPIIRGSNLSVTLDEPGFAWIRYAAPVRGPALPRTARR
jgi:6-pyruvoyl-tetrahydropterin synthase